MSSETESVFRASATAPVNIAVVKYWGKRDAKLNLPTNSSASVTLSQRNMRAHTTATCAPPASSSSDNNDVLILNGSAEPITARTAACIARLRTLRSDLESSAPTAPKLSTMPLKIVSENNFPTAAGLASSAAGFAALVKAVAGLYRLPISDIDLSAIARQGSGSACRSLLGGYVAWNMGVDDATGADSLAAQIATADHWPDMRALILVASAAKKDVGSTIGMQRTVATSQLFASRVSTVVPEHMDAITTAIKDRDFAKFANVTMRDSNSFHAVCLDSVPPIFYLADPSRAAIAAVTGLNDAAEADGAGPVAAYTFDAGPNAVIYFLHKNRGKVMEFLGQALASVSGWDEAVEAARVDAGGVDGGPADDGADAVAQNAAMDGEGEVLPLEGPVKELLQTGIKSVIYTAVGEGAKDVDQHLA